MYFHNLHRTQSQTTSISPNSVLETSSSDVKLTDQHRNSVGEATNNSPTPLTEVLISSHPQEFKAATQTDFLKAAGVGKVSGPCLSRWLSQDRLYAETYICFVSSLISRVELPHAFISDKSKSLRWRIVNVLTGCLTNIHQELEFFSTTAKKYGLELESPARSGSEFGPAPATQQYMELFRSFFNDPSSSLLEGLVVLWGTEQCYLSAWKHASQQSKTDESPDADGGALREAFIPNWTSNEFEGFVNEIADITNALAVREKAVKKLAIYKAVWLHVLDIEHRFWPGMNEEDV